MATRQSILGTKEKYALGSRTRWVEIMLRDLKTYIILLHTKERLPWMFLVYFAIVMLFLS